MWSDLPRNLKTVLGLAILGAIGVAAAAFRLSFIALREVASDPQLKFGKGNGWLLPIAIDVALVVSEVILLGASMVRVRNKRGELEPYDRTLPFLLVAIFGGATIYFNVTRVPADLRAVTVIPPAASILMTLALAYLVKMLARVSGADHIYEAPPSLDPRQITRKADVLHGEILRGPADGASYGRVPPGVAGYGAGPQGPPGLDGQTPTWAPSQLAQNGQPAVVGTWPIDQAEATKRRQVEAYLAALGGDQLGRLHQVGPRAAARELTGTLNGQGVQVSERYVQQIWDDWAAAQRGSGRGGGRRKR
jgi:Protein of unknown function (DUF2637)